MSRKIICLAISLLILTTLFAGCGSNNDTSANTSSGTDGTTAAVTQATTQNTNEEAFTIKVSSWDLIDEKADANATPVIDYKKEVEKEYKAIYPNATIQWDNTGNEKYFDLLKSQLASNTADDIIFHQNDLVPLAKAGYLEDLTNQLFASTVLDSTKPGITYQGKLLAVAQNISGWALWYNEKMFADNGWALPKTWAEFLKLCDTIKATGISPLLGGFKDAWTIVGFPLADAVDIMGANPNFEADLYNGKTKINGPEYAKMMGKVQTLFQNGYYNKDCLSINWDQSRAEFETGKGAMMIQGSYLPGMAAQDVKGFQTGFMPVPDENGNVFMGYGLGKLISVNANTNILDKANALLGVLIAKTPLELRLKDISFSGIKGTNVQYSIDGIKAFADALQNSPSGLQPTTFLPPSVVTDLSNIISGIIAGKEFDPASLDQAQSDYEKDKALVVISQ
jgi:raffinose/stachyose/melibiose transport system substrate-binding protein